LKGWGRLKQGCTMEINSILALGRGAAIETPITHTTPSTKKVVQKDVKDTSVDEKALQVLEEILKATQANSTIQMHFDKELNRIVIQVLNGDTKETIRQVPSEAMIAFIKKFKQYLSLTVEGRV
jgi:uncharacterized FlaG/YvyC family protein